jgi:hypothetical protein
MENLEQMTLEQLTALQKERTQRYTELNEQITDIKHDLFKINPILAQKMSHCSPLIGKKVKVVAQSRWSTETYTTIGFFGGYSAQAYGTIAIYPIVYKIKKDGTSSKNKYSDYEVPSIDYIISIEEVTE